MGDRSGEQVGDYQLLHLLGVGTFGEVYAAEQIYLKTKVAIKLLHAHLDQVEFQRFLAEARTIAALEHPHIVRVLSFSLQQQTPYLVMQLAQGSLKDWFTPGQPRSGAALLPYLKQAADGLHYAHDQRMMHLDIKPANLLLTTQNQVLLADFGLARVLQTQRTHQTLLGFAGTPAYAAPEQFQNKPGLASDQYALGVLVYQWLTGTLPFEGDWWAIGHQKLTKPPPPMRINVPSLSPTVEEVVLRALVPEPKDRFPDVRAFAAAFERALLSASAKASHTTFQLREESSAPSAAGKPGTHRDVAPFTPLSLTSLPPSPGDRSTSPPSHVWMEAARPLNALSRGAPTGGEKPPSPPLRPFDEPSWPPDVPSPSHRMLPSVRRHASLAAGDEGEREKRGEGRHGPPSRVVGSRPSRGAPRSSLGERSLPPPVVPDWSDGESRPRPHQRVGRILLRRPLLLSVLLVCVVAGTLVVAVPGLRSALFFAPPAGSASSTQPPARGSQLIVQVNVPNATVTVDTQQQTTRAGQTAPFSIATFQQLSFGTHTLTVHADRYADYSGPLTLPAAGATLTVWLAPSAATLTTLGTQFGTPAVQPDAGKAGDHYSPTQTAVGALIVSVSYTIGGLSPSPFTDQVVQGSDTQASPFQPVTLTLTPVFTLRNAAGTTLLTTNFPALPATQFGVSIIPTVDAKGNGQLSAQGVVLTAGGQPIKTNFIGPAASDYALYFAIASVFTTAPTTLNLTCIGAVDNQKFNPEDGLFIVDTTDDTTHAHYFYRWGILWATNAVAHQLTPNAPMAEAGSNEFNDNNTARANGSCGNAS